MCQEYTMLRVTKEIRDKLKQRSAMNSRTMIGELHFILFLEEMENTHGNKVSITSLLKSKPIEEKVQLVLDRMKERGTSTVRPSKTMDPAFKNAGKSLGINKRTLEDYWAWFYENKIRQ